MQQKDAYYFPHDSNARNDPKIVRLRRIAGLEGYGFYFCIVEMLREANGYKLDNAAIDDLCFDLRVDASLFQTIVDCQLLKTNGKHFWSESLLNRMKKLEDIREKRRAAGAKGGKAKAKAKQNPGSKEKKRKEKQKKEKETPPIVAALASRLLDAIKKTKPDYREPKTLARWIDDIDKLMRIDGVDEKRIAAVVDALPRMDFWSKNILSAKALRDKFDRLELEARKGAAPGGGARSTYDANNAELDAIAGGNR